MIRPSLGIISTQRYRRSSKDCSIEQHFSRIRKAVFVLRLTIIDIVHAIIQLSSKTSKNVHIRGAHPIARADISIRYSDNNRLPIFCYPLHLNNILQILRRLRRDLLRRQAGLGRIGRLRRRALQFILQNLRGEGRV